MADEKNKNWRTIIIQTDGNFVNIKSSELTGSIETVAVLQQCIVFLTNSAKQMKPAPPDEPDVEQGAPEPKQE